MYALFPWMQRYRVFDEPSKTTEHDASIAEDDLLLEKVSEGTHERSSFLVTPALLKSNRRGSLGAFDMLRSTLHSVRTENEILQDKVEALEASKQSVSEENEILRKKIEELEHALRRKDHWLPFG